MEPHLAKAQLVHPFAAHWGDDTKSSSDGQRFRTGGYAGDFGESYSTYKNLWHTALSVLYNPFREPTLITCI